MTFAASLAAASGKKPVWLYRFTVGSSVFHVTRRPAALFGGYGHVTPSGKPDASFLASQNWSPLPMETGRLSQSSETARSEWDVMIPAQSALGLAIRAYVDPAKIQVKAWQTFLDDPDTEYVVRFDGRVARRKPGTITMSLVCETGISELKYQANPPVIQRPCRHCHYFTPDDPNEAGCRLDPTPFKVAGSVTAVLGPRKFKVPAAGFDSSYTYGLLFHGGQEYFIEAHIGDELTLDRVPNPAIAFLSAVDIAPGCDGSLARCAFFGNTLNHGGFPFMTETPWTGWAIL